MKNENLLFKANSELLTLGVELELQVLDGESLLLTPRANELIEGLKLDNLKKEFFQSTLEVITGVCRDVHEAQRELLGHLQRVQEEAKKRGLNISSTGTHPEADYRDRLITPSPRYHDLMDRNQWIIRRMAVYGMHIHLAMASGDACIRFSNFFLNFVPHLLSLSASSPFWQRMQTGLACSRPTMYESMPTSGMPYIVKNWKAFQRLYKSLVRTGSIHSMKDLWWDLRPSPNYGTLELRICDEPATVSEAMAIAAYFQMLAAWYHEHASEWDANHKSINRWVLRENKWRAIRYGLQGEMILAVNKKNIALRDHIYEWLDRLAPYERRYGYQKQVELLKLILTKGNSSERQLTVYKNTQNLSAVTKHNVAELARQTPIWN